MPKTQPASFSLLRRWSIGFQVFFAVLVMLAIVVMINYLATRHYRRFAWSEAAQSQLSPFTRQMLLALTNEVRVTVLFDPEASEVYEDVKTLLMECQISSPLLRIDYVDYARNPGRAELVKAQYRISSSGESLLLIFDSAGRPPRVVRERELSEYDMSGAFQGQPVRRIAFKGEQVIAEAILWISNPKPFRAYYLTGHGEMNTSDEEASEGYFKFARLMAEKNVMLQPFTLLTNGVPPDADLLVIAGPRTAIPVEEMRKVEEYLTRGGRALVMLWSPSRTGVRPTGLDRLLARWSVELGNNIVLDPAQTISGANGMLLTDQLGAHPIVGPLQGMRVGLFMPCSVRPRAEGDGGAEASVTPLLTTSPSGKTVVSVRNGSGLVETNGVIPLAVAVEKGAISEVRADQGTTRLVVVGEAFFLANSLIDLEANRDFAALAVNWLLDRRQLIGVGARPVQEYRIYLTKTQMRTATWLLLGGMPGIVLLCGAVVWLRRRH